jgi:hypothetical protein
MPEQKGKPQEDPKGKPQEDDFISKIVKDPAQPPDVLLLTGYLGASSEPGYTRLYFDPQFSNYVEIPDAAILHTQKIPPEQSPLGESYVWIDKNAEIIHGKVGPNRPKAKFLEGPIFQDFMRGAQFGGAAAPQPAPRPTLIGSPTCAPELCVRPSIAQPCQTSFPIACPPQLTQLNSPTCAPELCLLPSIVQPCPPPQPTQLNSPTCAPAMCLLPSVAQPCPPPQLTQLNSPTCAPELCVRPSIVNFCPTPSAVQLCQSQPAICQPSVVGPCLSHPVICLTPSAVQQCPPITLPFCPTEACPPQWTPGSIACGWGQQPGGPGQAGGGGAMAQQVQPFAGAAPQPGLPPTQLFCPTHAPFFCPQTVVFCPTHPPFFCPQTVPPACPQMTPPQTVVFCPPTMLPALCPPTVLPFLCPTIAGCPPPTIAGCLPPWTPGSIACGWGQQPGGPGQPEGPGQAGGGAAMGQQAQPFAGAAPQPTPPQTQLFCPTHAPFFCLQTVPPACPQMTPPQTQLFCPTHAPFFCLQTVPPACQTTELFCPTHAPFFCPQVSLSPDCLTPWTPVSIACGWGQQPGGPGQVGGGPGQAGGAGDILPPGNQPQKPEQPGEPGQTGGTGQG